MREFTLIRSVNARLYKASINTCTKCEVMSEDSENLAFLNHVISRDQNVLQPQPTATTGLRLKFISLILLVFLMITKFYKRTKELWAEEIQIISIVFGTNITLFRNIIAYSFNQLNNMTGYHR